MESKSPWQSRASMMESKNIDHKELPSNSQLSNTCSLEQQPPPQQDGPWLQNVLDENQSAKELSAAHQISNLQKCQ